MVFSILLLLAIIFIAVKLSPRERKEDVHIHGAGQIGLLAAVALFGVDYFTSFYYGTGEMMSALHPYGLQKYGYIAAGFIAIANLVFGALYMYSLGIFNEGGGSYTASMRYLWPTLSLIVAVVLIQDYTLTIVVSALSGSDQLLSILGWYGRYWWLHFAIGAVLAAVTWYLTIRGRGESARVVFVLLGVFIMLTILMAIGLFIAHFRGVPPVPATQAPQPATIGQALYHLLTGAMKGMVALSGLEAMSNVVTYTGRKRKYGSTFATLAAVLAALVFVGQIVGKWTEGGWVVLITFSLLVLAANLLLVSPVGQRQPKQIHRIVREKARVQGAMASIVEWQSLRMQEYRHSLIEWIAHVFGIFGIGRSWYYEPEPVPAGDYDHALHLDHPDAPSLLAPYLEDPAQEPKRGDKPKETAPPESEQESK